jgi:8-oxo-dGTP diphosphatase
VPILERFLHRRAAGRRPEIDRGGPPVTAPAGETHPRVGVGVVVRLGRQILLVRRHGAHGAGTWSPPGGNLDFGETPSECAAREVEEETGVRIAEPTFAGATNDLFAEDGLHYVTLWFEADHGSGTARPRAADELSAVAWFREGALPTPLFAPFGRYLANELV